MSVSCSARFEGAAPDRHAPILARFPGIRRIVLHSPVEWRDPFPANPDRFALLAQVEPRVFARQDFANFPAFEGCMYHQAVQSEEVFSR